MPHCALGQGAQATQCLLHANHGQLYLGCDQPSGITNKIDLLWVAVAVTAQVALVAPLAVAIALWHGSTASASASCCHCTPSTAERQTRQCADPCPLCLRQGWKFHWHSARGHGCPWWIAARSGNIRRACFTRWVRHWLWKPLTAARKAWVRC